MLRWQKQKQVTLRVETVFLGNWLSFGADYKGILTLLGDKKKILKFFDADPGWGINIPGPQHWLVLW